MNCTFTRVADRWACQNAGCRASYACDLFPAGPPSRECGKRATGREESRADPQPSPTNPSASYEPLLASLIAAGRATRCLESIERCLAACRANRCGRWAAQGCRIYCGCDGSTANLFASFLSNASRRCAWWGEESS